MLRLRDARTGELTDVLPPGRRQLRVLVTAAGQVRAYLTADLLRRAAERSALLPMVSDVPPPGADGAALRSACGALNIHPPADILPQAALPDGAQPFDVGLCPAGGPGDAAGLARLWIAVSGDRGLTAAPGDDPLAVRLMLMRQGYATALGDGETAKDAAELARWRELVARWARSPSGAISRPYDVAMTDAFANDLDTPTALGTLAELGEDPGVPDGVKFETFAAADRLLGLDLARDIGR